MSQKTFRPRITQRPFTNPAQRDRDVIVQGLNDEIRRLARQTLASGAGLTLSVVTVTSAYTVTSSDYSILADATAGAVVVTLPTAVGAAGRIYNVKKIDSSANAVTITPNGAETIDGSATAPILMPDVSLTIQSDGANWWIL